MVVVYAGNSPLETARSLSAMAGDAAAFALEDGKSEEPAAGGGRRRGN
jgi:hypothetical protein